MIFEADRILRAIQNAICEGIVFWDVVIYTVAKDDEIYLKS